VQTGKRRTAGGGTAGKEGPHGISDGEFDIKSRGEFGGTTGGKSAGQTTPTDV
jgi:hypothetical protein